MRKEKRIRQYARCASETVQPRGATCLTHLRSRKEIRVAAIAPNAFSLPFTAHGSRVALFSRLFLLFTRNGQRLDRHLIAHRIKRRPIPFAWPRISEMPFHGFRSIRGQQNDGTILSLQLTVYDGQVPVIKVSRLESLPISERYRDRTLCLGFPEGWRFRAIAVVHNLNM
jgi:hypothetical protein